MKKLLIAGAAIIIAGVAAVVLTLTNLGPMVKEAVNTLGPQVTKTEVKVDDVAISILNGDATIKGFLLGNPQGFKSREAMSVGSMDVDIERNTITKNPIVINKIEIIAPSISYEKKAGTDNFKELLKNVSSGSKSGKAKKVESGQESEKQSKKIVINNVILKSGKVNLIMTDLGGQEVSARLPDIHLKDLGKGEQGITPAEAAEQIFAALYEKISAGPITEAFNEQLKKLGSFKDVDISKLDSGSVTEKIQATESAKESVEKATENLKGLFK